MQFTKTKTETRVLLHISNAQVYMLLSCCSRQLLSLVLLRFLELSRGMAQNIQFINCSERATLLLNNAQVYAHMGRTVLG